MRRTDDEVTSFLQDEATSFLQTVRAVGVPVKPTERLAIRDGLTTVSAEHQRTGMPKGRYFRVDVKVGAEYLVESDNDNEAARNAADFITASIAHTVYADVTDVLYEVIPALMEAQTPENYQQLQPVVRRLMNLARSLKP